MSSTHLSTGMHNSWKVQIVRRTVSQAGINMQELADMPAFYNIKSFLEGGSRNLFWLRIHAASHGFRGILYSTVVPSRRVCCVIPRLYTRLMVRREHWPHQAFCPVTYRRYPNAWPLKPFSPSGWSSSYLEVYGKGWLSDISMRDLRRCFSLSMAT